MEWNDLHGMRQTMTAPPQRMVSLVPSQTEFLHDLGLEQEVVGITKFCIHPKHWHLSKTRVGGTKDVQLQKVASLQPDLIIANREENTREQVEWLAQRFPVWVSDVKTLAGAADMMHTVGQLCYRQRQAEALVASLKALFETLPPVHKPVSMAYFIWYNPVMSVNHDTFIHDILQRMGGVNVFADRIDSRYPEVSEDQLRASQPEVILLSSEPFPFQKKHMAYFRKICPQAKVLLVDGEMFSWYGSRLLKAPAYLNELAMRLI
jgi:ABC-type Fe3+-hydroxamate transport system substrate-binding protein